MLRGFRVDFFAFQDDFPRIRAIHTCQYFHQCRFPCAIFSYQAVNFTFFKRKADIIQRLDAWEGFTDPFHDD